jgi:hypothetical protein
VRDYVSFRMSPEADGSGAKFQEVVDCHFAYDRLRTVRSTLMHGLGITSVGTSLMAIRPGLLHGQVARIVVALWLTCLAGAAVAGAIEWRLYRRRARLVGGLSPPERMVP